MSTQPAPLASSGTPTTGQAGTPVPPTPLNSTDPKPGSKSPAKAGNPKVVVQPVNPPISISLPVEQPMFTITQHKHTVEAGKIPTTISIAATPTGKPSQTVARTVVSKMVATTHQQPTTYMVPSSQAPLGTHPAPGTQSTPSTYPVLGTHIMQSAPVAVPSTHLLAAALPVPSAQAQVRLSTAGSPVVTSAGGDAHKVKVSATPVQTVTTGTQPGTVGGLAGHSMQQYVRGISMHPSMIAGTHVAAGQVQQHAFPSHLPRGAAAAAAMSAPKSGMTTAILRTTTPVSQTQFPNTATTVAASAVQSTNITGQQLQRHHQPPQVHLPVQHHLPGRLHSPAGLAGVGMAPTAPPGITRASSPGAAAASMPGHHASTSEAHRTLPHASMPQPHTQTAGHPFRPDIKQLPKSADKPKPDGKPDPNKPMDPTKPEVKLVDPRAAYSWVTVTQQQQQGGGVQKVGGAKHAYISSQGLGMQRMAHPAPQAIPASNINNQASSSLVTATTLSHHTVPSQSIIHSSIRTSAITVTTLSNQPQSNTTTIPVAKVYPRQMAHPPRPSTPYSEGGPSYVSAHSRNSPNTSAVTTVTALPPTVTMSDGRVERPPHPGAMSHGYPASMPPYFFDSMNYRHHMMPSYGTNHSFASMSAAGVRSTLADSHIRHTMHPTTPQNSSVAAAVVAAAHAATVGGPVRLNPVSMMIDSRRQVPVHNTMGMAPSLEGGVNTSTSVSIGSTQSSSNSPNPNASPRPSILKRRINNDSNVIRKLIPTTQSNSQPSSPKTELARSTSSSPKHSDSLASSQHSLDSNASEASLDALPSAIKIKQELETIHSESGTQASIPRDLSLTNSVGECSPSPRKKPRKQQHKVATEHHDILDDQSTDEETETKHKHFRVKKEKKEKKPTVSDVDHINVVHYFRRPCIRLIDTYRQSWKPTHNHFERYSDVRPKEEKKTTIHEIANQRGIVKKTDGWKVRHITYQFEDLSGLELDVFNEMKEIKEGMAPWQTPGKESDTSKIYELIQGNIQRSQYVMEHLEEAKNTMLKLLEHKPKVMSIIKNHANKRHAKKKHSP
ncbi:histone deacetylase complex subunit SAP130-like isoform X3 [Patiria miniata]|uniref:Histone deacetylase complex subunit SAP130 C-terminal domain-containing protein n=1 Tax=Patiria miniata TaxID=46514 RepID=A0A913ZFF7_PATMI|nr:histone deacetylase complex subunit SAP130-like isoform X3 [Patiria miniata]